MKKKYVPSFKDFMLPFILLIIGTILLLSTFWISSLIIKTIFVIVGIILIVYGVARILRIFLKIFLQEMKDWW